MKEAARYETAGKPIVCPHCEGRTFFEASALLNTRGLTFFNLDWADKAATTLACEACGLILWFMIEPTRQTL